jgi:hypothetical protein
MWPLTQGWCSGGYNPVITVNSVLPPLLTLLIVNSTFIPYPEVVQGSVLAAKHSGIVTSYFFSPSRRCFKDELLGSLDKLVGSLA